MSARYAGDGRFYLLVRVLQVDQLSGEVLLVGREVEVTVAAEVEEDGLLLSCLFGLECQVYGCFDGVRHLRSGHDPFRPGESDPGLEGGVLGVGPRLDESLVCQRRDYGGVAVVTQSAGVYAARNERVPERIHLHHRGGAGGIAEVVSVAALRKRGARGRLDGHDARALPILQVLADEREGHAAEVRAAPDAADDHIGVLAGQLHLLERFLPDHGLVQQHVVQDAPERVLGVVVSHSVLDSLAYGDPERARRVRVLLQDVAASLREVRGARVNFGPVSLHHNAPVWFLIVADADHVDRAIEAHHPAGECEGGAPLARPRLGGQAPDTLFAVVIRLGDGCVRLVAAGRRAALVLVVDVGRGVEEPLQTPGAEERGRAPEAIDLTHFFGDGNV